MFLKKVCSLKIFAKVTNAQNLRKLSVSQQPRTQALFSTVRDQPIRTLYSNKITGYNV